VSVIMLFAEFSILQGLPTENEDEANTELNAKKLKNKK